MEDTLAVDLTQDEFRDQIGSETSRMRLTDTTRRQYDSALQRFKRWLSDKHPELLNEDNDIQLPLPSVVITAFMYHAMLKVDTDALLGGSCYKTDRRFQSLHIMSLFLATLLEFNCSSSISRKHYI